MSKGIILSGMRPTGKLHIGHLSVLENWVKLQQEYNCFFTIVDWHALTTSFDETKELQSNILEMALDWFSVGIDPGQSAVFIQSHVKQHAELHLLFSMITPLSWLERVPTYKDQIMQLGNQGKDISTYGFLGYPLLQAADILVYRATVVPVGEDQLPHLELCREIARRFNHLFETKLFPEPQAKLAKIALLPGVDGRKMSKSYNNHIPISAEPDEIKEKVRMMVTDPARVRKTDPGNPDVCVASVYQKIYNIDKYEETASACRTAGIGCVACKNALAEKIIESLAPIRERRKELAKDPSVIYEFLKTGAEKARAVAEETMVLVREAIGI